LLARIAAVSHALLHKRVGLLPNNNMIQINTPAFALASFYFLGGTPDSSSAYQL
jgi:hypothetical protein